MAPTTQNDKDNDSNTRSSNSPQGAVRLSVRHAVQVRRQVLSELGLSLAAPQKPTVDNVNDDDNDNTTVTASREDQREARRLPERPSPARPNSSKQSKTAAARLQKHQQQQQQKQDAFPAAAAAAAASEEESLSSFEVNRLKHLLERSQSKTARLERDLLQERHTVASLQGQLTALRQELQETRCQECARNSRNDNVVAEEKESAMEKSSHDREDWNA